MPEGSHSHFKSRPASARGFSLSPNAQRERFPRYRGAALAMQDLVCRQIDLRFAAEGSQSLPYLRDGQIKALAVLAPARWAPTPDVPTIDEAGVPGLHLSLWNGIWAPRELRATSS
jgi:tripartite-type tricarboxylate transporter receptor subunit TctC